MDIEIEPLFHLLLDITLFEHVLSVTQVLERLNVQGVLLLFIKVKAEVKLSTETWKSQDIFIELYLFTLILYKFCVIVEILPRLQVLMDCLSAGQVVMRFLYNLATQCVYSFNFTF